MRDPWSWGRHFRSLHEMQDWKLRPTAPPSVDLPSWFEPALVACILAVAVIVLVLTIWPSVAS